MVDLMGHRDVGGKTLICLIDGLYTGKHAIGYPQNLPRKWQMEPFNNDWCSSIFASQDQVAIDSVAFDFLVTEWPDAGGPAHDGVDDYLHEAALANDPCSGTFYDPENDGTRLASLGVHEHWNNPIEKQYSRNLETGDGIELLKGPVISIADFDRDGKVDFKDFPILAQYWGEDEPLVDIAPAPLGDDIVNSKDLRVFAEHWLTATKIPPLPAPASILHPNDRERDVDPNDNLSWTAGADAVSHDVYFGTTNPPPFIRNQTATTYDPSKMAEGTGHYWRIDEVNSWGKTTGTVWRFTTGWDIPI
jgi:hypothetical protein